MPRDSADKIIMFAVIALAAWAMIGLPILYGYEPVRDAADNCIRMVFGICLVTPNLGSGGKIFSFAEFVQAFALLVLIYTVSDVRYRFRVATAPVPIWGVTFWLSAAIGAGTLVSDFWFTQRYPLPWFLAGQSYWQFSFGILFLIMVLIWLWFAFVRPPIFGRHNALRFTRALYTYLLQGAEEDLPVIAAELRRSAKAIVHHVNASPYQGSPARQRNRSLIASNCARDVLLLIANRKFCRHIVASSPGTAIAFFSAMSELRKYRIPIGTFASNVSTEALLNTDSILYHEDEGYYSGFFGYVRPFTNALYGDFHLVEALTEGKSPLDIDIDARWGLDGKQLEAYVRAALTTFESALKEGQFHNHSYALFRAFKAIGHATNDLYKLDKDPEGPDTPEKTDTHARLRAVVNFIDGAIDVLDRYGVQRPVYRRHNEQHRWHKDYYDHLADLMFQVIGNASSIKTKEFVNWSVQYGSVWSQFFSLHESATRRIVLLKLRRLLYDEVLHLERAPNFKSAAVLGFLLNVLGVEVGRMRDHRVEEYPLRKAVISWARRKYLWLVQRQHKVAAAAILGTISFDSEHNQLVKTYIEGLNLVAPTDRLDLDPPA